MSSADARFGVVVVAFQNGPVIADIVRSAKALADCGTVVVVDNGSDGACRRAKEAGAICVARPDNPGFGTSQNLGVSLLSEPYVLLLNPDAEVAPAAMAVGLDLLDACADVGAVQGVITNEATGLPERSMGDELRGIHLLGRALGFRRLLGSAAGRALARRVGLGDHADRVPTETTDVEWLAATAPLVRRRAFEDVGGFAEDHFLYGEDLDICRRWRLAGWRLVAVPVAWADHVGGGTSSSSWERELHWWRGTMRFGARWWSGSQWRLGLAAAVVRWVGLAAQRPRAAGRAWRSLVSDPRKDRRDRR